MSIFTEEQTPVIVLLRALTSKYGVDWMRWAPAVLRQTVEADFPDGISRLSLSKALAGAVVATQDSFWTSGPAFLFLAQALSGRIPVAGVMPELTVGQMMIAVDVAAHIRKDLGDLAPAPPFSEEVSKTVAAQALADGVWYLPSPLEFAARYAAGQSYRCKACGNVGPAGPDFDGICDACSGRFEMGGLSQLSSWRPDPRYVAEASKTVRFEKNPTEGPKRLLEKLLADTSVILPESQDGACAARAYVALKQLERHREAVKHAEAA